MTLHVINKTDPRLWQTLLTAVLPTDALVLIEDAVYAALPAPAQASELLAHHPGLHVCVLVDDLAARGISAKIRPGFVSVSYRDFVALSLVHERVVNWH